MNWLGRRCVTQPSQRLALMREDADTWADAGCLRIHRDPWSTFADIGDRITTARHAEPAGTMHVVPLRMILPLAVEYLHAMVFAIRDIHPAVLVAADVVHDVERARIG